MSFLVSARPPRPPRLPAELASEPGPAMTASAELDRHLTSAIAEFSSAKDTSMGTPIAGGFAAQLRAMMDEARAGIAQARAEGLSQVQVAVGELHEAKAAVVHVTGKMVQTIKDEAADIRAELGQISNDLGTGS